MQAGPGCVQAGSGVRAGLHPRPAGKLSLQPAGQVLTESGHRLAPSLQRHHGQLCQRPGQLYPGFCAGPGGQGLRIRQHSLPVLAGCLPPVLHRAEEAASGDMGRLVLGVPAGLGPLLPLGYPQHADAVHRMVGLRDRELPRGPAQRARPLCPSGHLRGGHRHLHAQIPMGLSIAVCVRVGTALGAADTVQAKRSAISGTLCTVGTSLVVGILLSLLRNKLGHIFTNDEEVVALVNKVLPLYIFFQLFDALCCLYAGVLRGTGRQAFGAVVNAVMYYAIGLPLGVVLTFLVGMGIMGLWLGMLVCVMLATAAFVTYTARMDWKRAAEEAQKHAGLPPLGSTDSMALGPRPGPEKVVVSSVATGSSPGVILTTYSRPGGHPVLLRTPEAVHALPTPAGRLSAKQLALRRGAALGVAVGSLIVGLILRVLTARP